MRHNCPKIKIEFWEEGKKWDEPNIIVAIAEEFTEYVDSHNTETTVCLRFNIQNGKHSFIEDGVSDIFRRVSIRCHLSRTSRAGSMDLNCDLLGPGCRS